MLTFHIPVNADCVCLFSNTCNGLVLFLRLKQAFGCVNVSQEFGGLIM